MCGVIGFGVAGLIGLVALVFGVGSIFNGMAAASTSLALLGQTLLHPVVILFVAVLGFVAGTGFVLGAPSVVRFYRQVKSGQAEAETPGVNRGGNALEVGQYQQLPAAPASRTVRRPKSRRRARIHVNMDRRL